MNKPAVIQATYATFRHVQGRKVLQIVFEVPEEKAGHTLAILGSPKHDTANWFAIAKLDPTVATTTDSAPQGSTPDRVKMAGILCNDDKFIEWLSDKYPEHWEMTPRHGSTPEDDAATVLRGICGIVSRRELANTPSAQEKFDRLKATYEMETRYPGR